MEKYISYKLENGKTVRIPREDIERTMTLGVDEDEAITIWLEDEGYLDNEEQNDLDKKAKASKITATIHQARADGTKKRAAVRKEDATKEGIIKTLAETLEGIATNVKIENVGKLITFTLGEDNFKLDLIRQRKPKK